MPIEIKHGKFTRATSVKVAHSLTELAPIVHNDASPGIPTVSSAVQPLKALSPIDTSLGKLETSTDVSESHPLKAPAPIVFEGLAA